MVGGGQEATTVTYVGGRGRGGLAATARLSAAGTVGSARPAGIAVGEEVPRGGSVTPVGVLSGNSRTMEGVMSRGAATAGPGVDMIGSWDVMSLRVEACGATSKGAVVLVSTSVPGVGASGRAGVLECGCAARVSCGSKERFGAEWKLEAGASAKGSREAGPVGVRS